MGRVTARLTLATLARDLDSCGSGAILRFAAELAEQGCRSSALELVEYVARRLRREPK